MYLIRKNRLSRAEISQIRKASDELTKNIKNTQTVSTGNNVGTTPQPTISCKSPMEQKVLNLVAKYRKDIEEADLPKIEAEMIKFFDSQPKQPYYLLMDRHMIKDDKRLVIIGDTHCDYNSLAAIFEKLSLSSYDYFENACFVFLGDYLDRGSTLFEYLMLLINFKKLMGDRCIFLKGNHETIRYNSVLQQLATEVSPANTCPTLNSYCNDNKEFLAKFADYFSNLPYYILLKTPKGTDLLVHGGIPRDNYMDSFIISHDTGELITDDERTKDSVLFNMIWSDPTTEMHRLQGMSSRFEFGQDQFEKFALNNKIDRLIRSHEPVDNGVQSYYNDRLFTLFSSGGTKNPLTYYDGVINPVIGIMGIDGNIRFESIFIKKVIQNNGLNSLNVILYNKEEAGSDPSILRLDDLHLNNEFFIINQ
ncbi:MAG: serine/threonine protein phosphatase [Bacteroidaceae bacterium]|nr:serine/threonine protein phosphatase [Bacteroidaceae bacterium]